MLATVHTYALVGIEALPVRVEVDQVATSFPRLVLVGLPDPVVRESRERIMAALRNQGFRFPDKKITVNLAPATLPKAGGSFDLPIAIGILVASGQAPEAALNTFSWAGELGLDGRLQPIRGALSMALRERRRGARSRTFVVPVGNGGEAAEASGVTVAEAATLREIWDLLEQGPDRLRPVTPPDHGPFGPAEEATVDLADVRGQIVARRALEIAAAGGHNLLFLGSPGTGKSMLAERLPTILPPLSRNEQLEVTQIHSVAGLRGSGQGLVLHRPFRAPHHTVSDLGLIGGGRPPQPGEVSLAHRGVLFLDELAEFRRRPLESLRQPLENGVVTVIRSGFQARFPSRFQLVAAMNPCPCGHRLDPRGGCRCTEAMVQRYLSRVSGPLMDRIDLQVEMTNVDFRQLAQLPPSEPSNVVRRRVLAAWKRQQARFGVAGTALLPNSARVGAAAASAGAAASPRLEARSPQAEERWPQAEERLLQAEAATTIWASGAVTRNADMRVGDLHRFCKLEERSLGLLRIAMTRLRLSPRAFHRIQRIARTIADLAGSESVREGHVSEAISYRGLDRARG